MSEFDEQASLMQWARLQSIQRKYPGIDLLEGTLNGLKLTIGQAGKAKAAGMLKGRHDLLLPVARGGFNGLSIELKFGKNKPTTEQLWYGSRMAEEGWKVAYCWTWIEAKDVIVDYLTQAAK